MIPVTPCVDLESVRNTQNSSIAVSEEKETLAVHELLDWLNSGDMAICVYFLQESIGDMGTSTGNGTAAPDGLEKRVSLPIEARKRFTRILSRLVDGQEGLSRLEIDFVRHIWHEVRGDWEHTVGAPIPGSLS